MRLYLTGSCVAAFFWLVFFWRTGCLNVREVAGFDRPWTIGGDVSCFWIRGLVNVEEIPVLSVSSPLRLVVGLAIHLNSDGSYRDRYFLTAFKKRLLP